MQLRSRLLDGSELEVEIVCHLSLLIRCISSKPFKQDAGTTELLKSQHGLNPALGSPIVPFDDGVQILFLTDPMGVSRSTLIPTHTCQDHIQRIVRPFQYSRHSWIQGLPHACSYSLILTHCLTATVPKCIP
jgi:hypothetical protein